MNRGLPNIAQLLTPQALLNLLQLDRKTSGGEDVAAIRLHRLGKLDFVVERGEGHLFKIWNCHFHPHRKHQQIEVVASLGDLHPPPPPPPPHHKHHHQGHLEVVASLGDLNIFAANAPKGDIDHYLYVVMMIVSIMNLILIKMIMNMILIKMMMSITLFRLSDQSDSGLKTDILDPDPCSEMGLLLYYLKSHQDPNIEAKMVRLQIFL